MPDEVRCTNPLCRSYNVVRTGFAMNRSNYHCDMCNRNFEIWTSIVESPRYV